MREITRAAARLFGIPLSGVRERVDRLRKRSNLGWIIRIMQAGACMPLHFTKRRAYIAKRLQAKLHLHPGSARQHRPQQ